jgi:hypothetical protein
MTGHTRATGRLLSAHVYLTSVQRCDSGFLLLLITVLLMCVLAVVAVVATPSVIATTARDRPSAETGLRRLPLRDGHARRRASLQWRRWSRAALTRCQPPPPG